MKRLDNKVAIVTGASKGIEAGIAKAFGAEGGSIINIGSTESVAAGTCFRISCLG